MVFQSHTERPGGMNSQEIFLSIAPDATTLVLSANFIDASGDKAFILPLATPPSEVRDGDPNLFPMLTGLTAPWVQIYDEDAEYESYGCGNDGSTGGASKGGVEVLGQGSTATYDYVVVGGESGSSLAEWLDMSGFGVPEEFGAALDDYAEAGWTFLAATLAAGVPDGQLAPLELRLPSSPTLATIVPFGIAGYGLPPGEALDVVLYVASPSGPVLPQNYALATIDEDAVVATSAETSNYAELFDEAIADAPTWVVEYGSSSWEPSDLSWWAVDANDLWDIELDSSAGDPSVGLGEFVARLGYEEAHLTRLRARLGPEELADLQLDMAEGITVDRRYILGWSAATPNEGCSTAPAPMGASLLSLALLGLVRRRRRDEH